jgi:hypothetical protein
MDADKFVARWTIIIHDERGPQAAPWQQAMTPGASFEITKDAYGVFWYLPSPEMKAPMNQPCRLATSREKHGSFDVGVLLPGTMVGDFGGQVGKLWFSINLIEGRRRIINLSQSHGGNHGVD